MLLRLFSNSPNGTQLTLVNGAAVTGYSILNSIDWGNAVFQQALSGARGTQGARAVAGVPDNRVVSIPVHIGPTGSVDSFNLKAAQLAEIVDEMRRFGGTIQWQATTQTVRQYLDVIGGCGLSRASWGRRGRIVDVGDVDVIAQCAPYMLGDPMDTIDGFTSDTLTAGDWTFDVANSGAGALSVAGGQLVPGATGTKRLRYTAKGYAFSDVQVTAKITTGATLTNGVWGVSAKVDPAGTDFSITAQIAATPTNQLQISLYGVVATSSTAFTPAANTSYWLRLRLEGHVAIAEVFTRPPNAALTPTATVTMTLTALQAQKYGASGHVGLRLQTVDTTERYDDFVVEPFTYRSVSNPEQIRVGTIPGDVPAMVDATLTPKGGTATPIFGLLGWSERPLLHNMVWNGDFEVAGLGTSGWSVAAVTGVIGAGSSLTRLTAQPAQTKYGVGALQIATPATTDTGAAFQINRRIRNGRVLMAWAWASSSAGTTSARIKVGANGNVGTGTAAALSATPKLYSVFYTVSGITETFYVAFGVNAATATNIVVDGVGCCEVPMIALSASVTSGALTGTVYATPSDTPNLLADGTISAPFLAMIEQEIVRVTGIAGNTWTWDRAQEGTTAASHAQDVLVGILPPLRPHFEGKGAYPPFGSLDVESYASGLAGAGAGAFSIVSDANARLGNVLRWAPATSGPQNADVPLMIDPNLMIPDDYTDGELDVEVWLREAVHVSLTAQRVTLSALPEGGTGVGPERFSREYGNVGKLLVAPSSGKVNRWHRLGTLPFTVDRSNPLRWQINLALACTGGATPQWDLDTLVLVPTRARLASPTGEINDVSLATAAYPSFVPYNASWGSTSAMSKTLRSDMTAAIATPGDPWYPDAGLGDVLEMPDTDVDAVCMFSALVPDDPTLNATDSTPYGYAGDLHLAVTPRYVLARAS